MISDTGQTWTSFARTVIDGTKGLVFIIPPITLLQGPVVPGENIHLITAT